MRCNEAAMNKETDIQKIERWLHAGKREEEIEGKNSTRPLTEKERRTFQQIVVMPEMKTSTAKELCAVYLAQDTKLKNQIAQFTSIEVSHWLQSSLAKFKGLGSDFGASDEQCAENEAIAHLAQMLQDKGAIKVVAVEVCGFLEQFDNQVTDKIVIELPLDKSQRKSLFAWAQLFYRKRGCVGPPDVGQKFLLIHWN